MRNYYLLLLFGFACNTCFGQNYAANLIPDSLKVNAEAVKRFEEVYVIIKSPSVAVVKEKCAYTILNEDGARHATYNGHYSKLIKLNDVQGKLYDATGKLLKIVRKRDISDFATDDDMSLMTDDRVKQHNFYFSNYPYTVEYESETQYDGTFFLPRWLPVEAPRMSVQESNFIIETPGDYQLRYKHLNIGLPVTGIIRDGVKSLGWQLKNKVAMLSEPYQPQWRDVTPFVMLAPSQFTFGGYQGNMSSWKDLGSFMHSLYIGRDQLPPAIKQDVQKLTSNLTGTYERIDALYRYLQDNTRYISIQLGIGGWQPFDANFVASKKYGDCKALSNYMVSLLKEAGVKAYPVIIRSGEGERGLWDDFPAPFFNHVVMCVPLEKDTLWLECTNQTIATGYMGSSTCNRKALMVTENGGYVVSTPTYGMNENLQSRKIKASIDAEGNLLADVHTRFTGIQQETPHALIHQLNQEQREKYLNTRINLPTYKIEKFEYKEFRNRIPAVDEYLTISSPSYASVSGKRMFIVPNIFNKSSVKLENEKPRTFPIEFELPYRDVDSVFITVPAGYQPESVPKNVNLSSKFGNYSITYIVQPGKVTCVRLKESMHSNFPPEDYPLFVSFHNDIFKADRQRVVLLKQE